MSPFTDRPPGTSCLWTSSSGAEAATDATLVIVNTNPIWDSGRDTVLTDR